MNKHLVSLGKALFVVVVLGVLAWPVSGQELPAAKPEAPPGVEAKPPELLYALNYEAAPLGNVVRDIMDILGLAYVADPAMDSAQLSVTLRTTSKLRKSELLPILEAVCQLKGFAVRLTADSLYAIQPASPAAPGTLPVEAPTVAAPGLILQVMPLNYISQNDAVATLAPFVSRSGTVVPTGRNNLLVAGYPKELERLYSIISLVDVPPTDRKLFTLEIASPQTVVEQLQAVFAYEAAEGSPLLQFVAVPYLNAVLVRNSSAALLAEVEQWIEILDREPSAQAYRTYYYEVKARPASHIAELLNEIYGEGKPTVSQPTQAPPSGAAAPARQTRTEPASSRTASTQYQVFVTADNNRNLVVIYTTPEIYTAVEETIRKLDQAPRQVLIEVMVAEVTLSDEMQLGLEWAIKHGDTPVSGLVDFSAGLGTTFATPLEVPELKGLNYLVTQTNKFISLLHALETESRLRIISSPSILSSAAPEDADSDTPQSRIEVVDRVPVVTTSVSEGQILESVQYEDAGVKLFVSPQAIWEDSVNLRVSQEVSQPVEGAREDKPEFFKRILETTVTVYDGQTLVIGGLIQRSSKMVRTGVPYLGRVPILRWLFEYRTPKDEAKELVVVMTPRVISSPDQAQKQSQDAMDFIELMKKRDFGGELSLRKTLKK